MTREHPSPALLRLPFMTATNIDSILQGSIQVSFSGHLVVVISFDRTTQQENVTALSLSCVFFYPRHLRR